MPPDKPQILTTLLPSTELTTVVPPTFQTEPDKLEQNVEYTIATELSNEIVETTTEIFKNGSTEENYPEDNSNILTWIIITIVMMLVILIVPPLTIYVHGKYNCERKPIDLIERHDHIVMNEPQSNSIRNNQQDESQHANQGQNENSPLLNKANQIGKGAFGNVYKITEGDKTFAVKKIIYESELFTKKGTELKKYLCL